MTKQIFFLLGIILSVLSACKYEYPAITPESNNDTINAPMEQIDSVSFANNVFPIISQNCLSCHNGYQPPNLTTYESINANASAVKRVTSNRSMPIGGSLSNDEIETIVLWVDQGAENN